MAEEASSTQDVSPAPIPQPASKLTRATVSQMAAPSPPDLGEEAPPSPWVTPDLQQQVLSLSQLGLR